ncbi:hypothetical protein [Anaerospora hongkongensis]|uniref:hypothetical protein n=1 Tax=Anaerospora hongkongensis TaxID=244830 RepID=UPI0028973BB2|nr:hypothetical protein [Anaerospora hongkongensis]
MDDKVKRLKQFYASMDFSMMKLEIKDYDWEFIDLIEKTCTIDYVELKSKVHKYRLRNMPQPIFDYLIKMHIEQAGNVCGYFDKTANNVCCFNLDSKAKDDADALTMEMHTTLYVLRDCLREIGIEPLITQSGKGFHVWVRMCGRVPNEELQRFMMETQIRVRSILTFYSDINYKLVQFSCYPSGKEENRNSLRLFGSTHARNKKFSNVIYGEDTEFNVLTEEQSWNHLAWHMFYHALSVEKFREAAKLLHDTLFNRDRIG